MPWREKLVSIKTLSWGSKSSFYTKCPSLVWFNTSLVQYKVTIFILKIKKQNKNTNFSEQNKSFKKSTFLPNSHSIFLLRAYSKTSLFLTKVNKASLYSLHLCIKHRAQHDQFKRQLVAKIKTSAKNLAKVITYLNSFT